MRSTAQLRAIWGPPCRFRQATVSLNGAGKVTVDAHIVPAVKALDAVLRRHRYRTRWADTGAFVCRRITGGTGYSLHAYGIALDINWSSNPYSASGRLITDMPRAMVADIKQIRTNNGTQVWGWGGDYTSVKDAMHWEVVASPSELAGGIRGGILTVPQPVREEFTVDAEARSEFDALRHDVSEIKGGLMRMQAMLDEAGDDWWKSAARRTRLLLEHFKIPDK